MRKDQEKLQSEIDEASELLLGLHEDYMNRQAEIAEIESALGDPAFYAKDAARAAQLTARLGPAKEELDAAETRWLDLSMR